MIEATLRQVHSLHSSWVKGVAVLTPQHGSSGREEQDYLKTNLLEQVRTYITTSVSEYLEDVAIVLQLMKVGSHLTLQDDGEAEKPEYEKLKE